MHHLWDKFYKIIYYPLSIQKYTYVCSINKKQCYSGTETLSLSRGNFAIASFGTTPDKLKVLTQNKHYINEEEPKRETL